MNWKIINFAEVSSTNDVAKSMSANPPSENFVITAQTQTHGRGRRGRKWESLNGNLLMSQAFVLPRQDWTAIAFVISLSLYQAVASFNPQGSLHLKWPNDLLLNNHKISGILLEKGENQYIIAGIGINLQTSPHSHQPMLYPAASLADFGVNLKPEPMLRAYLTAFDKNLALWQKQGFNAIRTQWLNKAQGLGQEITVNMEHKSESGIFAGIDLDGALLLQQGQTTRRVLAGDIFYNKEQNN